MLPMRKNQSKEGFLRTFERETQSSSRRTLCKCSPYDRQAFSNHPQGRNMPIILNVFSLCDASDSKSREMRRNINEEYNLPIITPPCSPPLGFNGMGTTSVISETYGSCYERRTCLPCDLTNSSNGATVNSTVPNNLFVNNFCAQNATTYCSCEPPKLQSPENCTLQYLPGSADCGTNVVNGIFRANDEERSFFTGQNQIVHFKKSLPEKRPLMYHRSLDKSNGLKPTRTHSDSERKISTKRQYVIEKLVQHIKRNKYSEK